MTSTARTAEQFYDFAQRRQASELGMWVFLATEILFVGALFFVYTLMRIRFPGDFGTASRHTDVLIGTINTAVLLTSSLTMALAARAAELRRMHHARLALLATAALGAAFLVLKGFEYRQDALEHLIPHFDFRFEAVHRRGAEIFFGLYFLSTGVHALHLLIGVAAVLVIRRQIGGALPSTVLGTRVSVLALYWHFVDIVWIFLYPILYLVRRA